MSHREDEKPDDWDLEEWEGALTIQVGSAFVCRICGNIVMVTRGGVGVMELVCCGVPMEKIDSQKRGAHP